MIARNVLLMKPVSRMIRRFGKKMSDFVDVEKIEEDPVFTPQVPLESKTYNFNREQFPDYEKKVIRAME